MGTGSLIIFYYTKFINYLKGEWAQELRPLLDDLKFTKDYKRRKEK